MTRLYEITDTNYKKYFVKNIKSDKEARKIGKKVFGRYYFGISFYSRNAKTSSIPKYHQLTKHKFEKLKWRYK